MATKHRDDTVLEASETKLKPPPLYKVMLLNDDYTPMDFVVLVIQNFFYKSREQATQIMLKVHSGRHGSVWRISPRCCGNQGRASGRVRPPAPASAAMRDGGKLDDCAGIGS